MAGFESKRLDAITECDLRSLIASGQRERRTLDVKAALPGPAPADATEFLYDVSSFANSAGGNLIFGLRERDGILTEIAGLQEVQVDSELSRLQSLIQDGIDPRIPGIDVSPVMFDAGGAAAIVIRIPRSPQLPHMVTHRGRNTFYGRNSNGKYPLRTSEIRALMLSSAQAGRQAHDFREERLELISSGGAPVSLLEGGRFRCVVHLVPSSAFGDSYRATLRRLDPYSVPMLLFREGSITGKYNKDGYLRYQHAGEHGSSTMYVQIFHSGSIEGVGSFPVATGTGHQAISGLALERQLLDGIPKWLELQETMEVVPPILIMISLVGVEGIRLIQDVFWADQAQPIEDEILRLPPAEIDSFSAPLPEALRDVFDEMWQASGFPRSPSYTNSGEWKD